jgi:heterotetrameric sarcosine oxidase gamma subunit
MPPTDGGTAFVSDMTNGLAVFEIAGPRAADIIAASCTLAPSGPELAPGHCAQTVFGGVRVILYVRDGRFRLHVERQLAAFLLEWFSQAASALL